MAAVGIQTVPALFRSSIANNPNTKVVLNLYEYNRSKGVYVSAGRSALLPTSTTLRAVHDRADFFSTTRVLFSEKHFHLLSTPCPSRD